jgi:hypothetical protein
MVDGFNNTPPILQQGVNNLLEGNIGGIISTRPIAKYMSGARTILRINSNIVGFAFSVAWRIETSYTEIETIDDVFPAELAPRRVKVDGSVSALHIPGKGPGAQLWQPDVLSFLFNKYITIEVRDSQTNQLLFFTDKAVIATRQEEIRVDDLAQVSLNFLAIGFLDERAPNQPNGVDTTSTSSSGNGDLNQAPTQNLSGSSGLVNNLV